MNTRCKHTDFTYALSGPFAKFDVIAQCALNCDVMMTLNCAPNAALLKRR